MASAGKGTSAPARGMQEATERSSPAKVSSTVTRTLAKQIGMRWMEHIKTSRWSKTAHPQLLLELSETWPRA